MNETQETIPYLREITVFLAVTGLLVPVLQRVKITPVLGFLVAGVLIGPYGLALFSDRLPFLRQIVISDIEGVRELAGLGIIFLLFTIGLELSFERIWRMRGLVFGLGGLQMVVTATAIGFVAGAFGQAPGPALIAGAALAMSSTAVVMQLLTEQGRLATQTGRVSFAVLLLQDLAVIPLLFLVGALAGETGASVLPAFGLALGKAVLAIGAIVLLGRLVMRPLFRFVGVPWNPEVFMAITLLVILATATATAAAGLSMALGAFLAGLLLAETEYRHQIDVDIAPFKGLLLGLFFVSVGMGIDVRTLGADWPLILGAVLGLLVLKSIVVTVLCLIFRQPRAVAIETGLMLGQAGEFAFVLAGVAMATAVISRELGQFILIVTSLTMVAAPLVALFGRRVGRYIAAHDLDRMHASEMTEFSRLSGHVVIAGYGRVGALLGDVLESQNVKQIAFDLDSMTVAHYRLKGRHVFYGDAARTRILERANAGQAQALVVTMDDPYAAEGVVSAARRSWPNLPIYARARDLGHATRLIELGATKAVPENLEASLQLAQETLIIMGVPPDAAWRLCETMRGNEALIFPSRTRRTEAEVPLTETPMR